MKIHKFDRSPNQIWKSFQYFLKINKIASLFWFRVMLWEVHSQFQFLNEIPHCIWKCFFWCSCHFLSMFTSWCIVRFIFVRLAITDNMILCSTILWQRGQFVFPQSPQSVYARLVFLAWYVLKKTAWFFSVKFRFNTVFIFYHFSSMYEVTKHVLKKICFWKSFGFWKLRGWETVLITLWCVINLMFSFQPNNSIWNLLDTGFF